jgi:ParB family chromosome partitioning protein
MAKKNDLNALKMGLRRNQAWQQVLGEPIPTEETEKKQVIKELSNTVADIPIADIEVNPDQPRKDFDEETLQELAESIKTYGLIQPITVRHDKKTEKFQIISGERRYRASKIAGLQQIPAYVRIADDAAMLEMALVENIQREDLNAIEIATTYERLIEECRLTHDQLSERVGKKRSTVTNYMNLLHLPPIIKKGLKEQRITTGHAKAIKGIDKTIVQEGLYERTLHEELSVREVEKLVKTIKEVTDDSLMKVLHQKVNDLSISTKDLMTLIHSLEKIQNSLLKYQLFERIADANDPFYIQDLEDIARFLSPIDDKELKELLYKEIKEERSSLIELATFVEKYLVSKAKANQKKETDKEGYTRKLSPEYETQERFLKAHFEVPISLKIKENGEGVITIPFKDVDTFNAILDKIKGE